jgi:hypothetical protein
VALGRSVAALRSDAKVCKVADQSHRVVTSGSGPEVSRQLGVMGVLPCGLGVGQHPRRG